MQLLIYFSLISLIYMSVSGYGKILLKLTNIKTVDFNFYKTIEFLLGLYLLSFAAIIINIFFKLNDYLNLSLIIFGLIFFLITNISLNQKKKFYKEILHILYVSIISISFSYYARTHDDFNYHFTIITNFKNFNLDQIIHQSRVSYNSIWLFINSIFYITTFKETLFIITSIFYTLIIYDLYFSFKTNFKKDKYLPMIYSFFTLIFLIGVLNTHKEYGTDFPGQLILSIILIILFEKYDKFDFTELNKFFTIFLILSLFSISIKISNSLIILLLIIIFYKIIFKFNVIIKSLIFSLPFILWLYQNIKISSCLLWPIHFTCFNNKQSAKDELTHIEQFAKGDIDIIYGVDYIKALNWIPNWFNTHFHKFIEIYLTYLIIFIIPIVIFTLFKSKSKIQFNNFFIKYKNIYIIFIIITLLNFIFWFLKTPSYRFSVINNLNLIIIFLLPFWYKIYKINKYFFKYSTTVILLISILVFTYKNIAKYEKYQIRYGNEWPPEIKAEL